MKWFQTLSRFATVFLFVCFVRSAESELSGVTARDCVQVRYIEGTWLNAQGTQVAYLVKSPDLDQNRNDYQLYIKDLQDKSTNLGRLLVTATDISAISWWGDGSHLAMLMLVQGVKTLISVDVENRSQETLLSAVDDIQEYSFDRSGKTLAYTVADEKIGKHSELTRSAEDIANGYRVQYVDSESNTGSHSYSVYVTHRGNDGRWTPPDIVSFEDPFTHEKMTHLQGPVFYLSLSPNGKRLAINYWTRSLLTDWNNSPWVQSSLAQQSLNRIMVIKELDNQRTFLGISTVYPDSGPLWARDSKSFLINAHSPVGTVWEQDDIRDHRTMGLDANLFWVDVESGRVEEVLRRPPDHHEGPLFWREDGDVVVHMLGDVVARFHHDRGSWREMTRINVAGSDADRFAFLASDGETIVGVHQTLTRPENLFLYDPSEGAIHILTDLNPQLRQLRFAQVRKVTWSTADGLNIDGLLFMPPDYAPGKRYPLVIQTKGDGGGFTCDSGGNHDPSFGAQPIANAGMMYLARTTKPGWNQQDEVDKAPKGYPGNLGFVAQQMTIWDSAVASLAKEGLIDPSRVGIIGFSATGYFVEFALVHSQTHYKAATAADNTQRSFSEYWLYPASRRGLESEFGGPPFGVTLKNWLDYSISFNLDKIHTPLLIESMGYGVHDDVVGEIPIGLAGHLEIVAGLARLGKPVEIYYYPNELHQPDHPKARLSSLQRNVDWYRFWLQESEDSDPPKANQYLNWHRLRDLHNADMRSSQDHSPPATVPKP